MSISIRPDWNGNDAAVKLGVAEALVHIKTNPSYEILPPDVAVRPYGDIDGKVGGTKEEFDAVDALVKSEIERAFGVVDQAVALYTSSSWEMKKISWRWVVPDRHVMSTKLAKKLAIAVYAETKLPDGVKGDLSVYSSFKKMRMLGTSKPMENRPLKIVSGSPIDTLITHIPSNSTLIEVDEDPVAVSDTPMVVVAEQKLVDVCALIGDERWKDYTSCLALIFALKASGACDEFIHEQCMRAANYSRRWVADAIRNWKADRSPKFGTLMYYARLDNPLRLESLIMSSSEVAIEELMKLDTSLSPIDDLAWCDDGKWLKELPIDGDLAVSSMLGTGKTRRMIDLCRKPDKPCIFSKKNDAPTYKRILFISVRITFSDHILSEIELTDYRNKPSRTKEGMITADRSLVSIQSLWRYEGVPDLVILDESETILANLSPNTTHGKHYLDNIAAFERIVRGAGRVVALDAFLTDRTLDLLRILRPAVRVLVNPAIPFNRTAKVFCEVSPYLTECDKRIRAGKKAYMFWGAKEKGKAFHGMMKCNNRMYYADSDPEIKKRDLSDVNTHWAGLQVVGATSSISVGVNYTGQPSFDQVFAYVTAWAGGSGRDTMQSIFRVRTLLDDQMVFFIDPKPNTFVKGEMGLAEQTKEYGQTTDRHREFLKQIGESVTDYSTLPQWLRSVIIWNRNERIVNAKHLRAVCFAYMKRCGIAVTLDGRSDGTVVIEKTQCRHHSEIDDIEYEQVESYERNRSVLTEEQKLELEKHYLMRKIVECKQGIWEQWLKNRSVINNAWALFNLTPKQIIHSGEMCVDLISRDAQKLAVVLSVGIDFNTEWSRPLDELPELNLSAFGTRKQGKKEGKEVDYREFARGCETFCGLNLEIVAKKTQTKGVRTRTYSLSYKPDQNPLLSTIRKPITCAEAFGVEE
jgi:hypothetical protein